MGLDKEQKEFLSLLIDRDRAGIKQYQDELNDKIKKLRHLYTKSEDYITKKPKEISTEQSQLYYLYPETQLVHLSFAIAQFQVSPEKVKIAFNLSDDLYQQIIKILLELDLIEISNNKIQLVQSNLHLPKDSPFFHQWQLQMKLKGLEHIKALSDQDKYNFTVSFTASDEDKEQIRLEFMKYLKKVEAIVKKSESENLYQMDFNLFKWV